MVFAPVGSVLVGSRGLIERAHRWRKVLGGGMRQSGILAAACLYALEHHYQRLEQDHHHASRLARGLAQIEAIQLQSQATNMVFVQIPQAHCASLEVWLRARGVLAQILPATRLVTHLDVSAADIDRVLDVIKAYFAANRA